MSGGWHLSCSSSVTLLSIKSTCPRSPFTTERSKSFRGVLSQTTESSYLDREQPFRPLLSTTIFEYYFNIFIVIYWIRILKYIFYLQFLPNTIIYSLTLLQTCIFRKCVKIPNEELYYYFNNFKFNRSRIHTIRLFRISRFFKTVGSLKVVKEVN